MPVALMLLEVAGLGSQRFRAWSAGRPTRRSPRSRPCWPGGCGSGIWLTVSAHDEIAVLLPLTDAEAATAVTERMAAPSRCRRRTSPIRAPAPIRTLGRSIQAGG